MRPDDPASRRYRRDRARAQIRQSVGHLAGPAGGVVRFLERFDRPTWLYHRLPGHARSGQHRFRAAHPVGTADVELCERLIAAYRLAQSEAPRPTGMWADSVFDERQRTLIEALRRGDPRRLAELLSSMFQSDFVIGMAPGSLFREDGARVWKHLAWLTAITKLVALAEAVGATRTENPEQGHVAPALSGGIDGVAAAIEQRLGMSLDFPQVGAAYGALVGDRVIPPEAPELIYGAVRLREVLEAYAPPVAEPPTIVEIGGGYGSMAYWFLSLVDARYVIVDLAVVNVMQGYFLAQALGHDAVSLHGEPPARITIAPGHALATVPTPVDVLANKDSLPEISRDDAIRYLEWGRANCRGAIYSYNQESAAVVAGTAQNVVCELVEQVGGFKRVRRDASWLRRGYVEEVFVPSPRA